MFRKTSYSTTIILFAAILYLVVGKLFNTPLHWPILFIETAAQAANNDHYHPGHLTVEQLCDRYPLICVGEVVKADLEGKFWSGFALSTAAVEYKVVKVLKGTYDKPTLIINEVIACPSNRVTKNASLSPQFFAPGKKLLLCLCYDAVMKKYQDDEHDECVQPYTAELEQRFLDTLRSTERSQ